MEFVLWLSRALHALGIATWLGGLVYQEVILHASKDRGGTLFSTFRNSGDRFAVTVWISLIVVGLTGIILTLASRRFTMFQINENWSLLLTLKELVFILILVFAYSHAKMLRYLEKPTSNGGFDQRAERYRHRIHLYRRIGIALGITALLLSSGMRVGG